VFRETFELGTSQSTGQNRCRLESAFCATNHDGQFKVHLMLLLCVGFRRYLCSVLYTCTFHYTVSWLVWAVSFHSCTAYLLLQVRESWAFGERRFFLKISRVTQKIQLFYCCNVYLLGFPRDRYPATHWRADCCLATVSERTAYKTPFLIVGHVFV
jgi:hypothetical protein